MTDVHLRLLGPDDAECFQRLRLRGLREAPEAFGTTHDEDLALPLDVVAERLRPARAPAGRAVVGAFAEGGPSDDALVGFAGCLQSPKRKSRHTAEVWGMYVAPEARGRGVGRRLLERLVEEARAWDGVERLTLRVVERAEPARRLYAALGFEVFGREPDAFRQDGRSDAALHLALAFGRGPRGGAPAQRAARVEHVAVWTRDAERLERLRAFYLAHFGATAGPRYASARRPDFVSYFLHFPAAGGAAGARLELMAVPGLHDGAPADADAVGYAHLALAVGDRAAVDALVARLRAAGVPVESGPRDTGDGYYEAVVRDPDGNRVEVMAEPEAR